jgi:hypothetical protein
VVGTTVTTAVSPAALTCGVVGATAGERLRVGAGVGVAEAHAGVRGGEHEKDDQAGGAGHDRAALHHVAPTGPEALLAAVAADEGQSQAVDAGAEEAQQRR